MVADRISKNIKKCKVGMFHGMKYPLTERASKSQSSVHICAMSGNNIVPVVTIHENNTRVRRFLFIMVNYVC